jgi:hypothetical protein
MRSVNKLSLKDLKYLFDIDQPKQLDAPVPAIKAGSKDRTIATGKKRIGWSTFAHTLAAPSSTVAGFQPSRSELLTAARAYQSPIPIGSYNAPPPRLWNAGNKPPNFNL